MSEVRTVERHGASHDHGGEDASAEDLGVGEIKMWYGVLTNLPPNWQNCDGTNGTPDLRDRVPVGAGTTYALGDTGGATTSTPSAHSGTAVADHNMSNHVIANHTVNDHGNHVHTPGATVAVGDSGSPHTVWDAVNSGHETAALTHNTLSHNTLSHDSEFHTVTQPAAHSALSVLQPYAAVYFVMRIA